MPDIDIQSTLSALPADARGPVERALAPTLRLAALGRLAADVAHDAGNSVFALLGLVDLMLEDSPPGSKQQERLGMARDSALILREDLRAVVEFGTLRERDEVGAFDDAVRTALRLVRFGDGKRLEIDERFPPSPLLVERPAAAVELALHLLGAGRDAAHADGRLAVAVRSDQGDAVLEVAPCTPGGLPLVVAARLAADRGGSVATTTDGVSLRLPLA